ncbi:glycosyltransferase family 10 [Hymenobacter sp. YC55]|uniref:glycosyltransferase family 10 domain-containing protein n=1 Tax=Hymenobacter sp. YC55 TaxID=3034019 RepID=UPI0023F8A458|nr:glycosyltransferase family 10 [Hymenobacter sp. YC55]MDF7810194.1 glycosyltransferase family 10 [Hymenobacter sp. YC55]
MKATLVVLDEPDFLNNRIFSDLPINGVKNYGYMFAELRRQLAEFNIDLATHDIHPAEESSIIIGLDVVDFFQTYKRKLGQALYLLLNEPATYYPKVWDKSNHAVFDKIFTYDYTLADDRKYIHHYFAIDLEAIPPLMPVSEHEFNRRELCVLMAGMFQVTKPTKGSTSLLYDRYQIMKWFSRYHPQDFALYSRGINLRHLQSFRGLGVLQRVLPTPFLKQITDSVVARRKVAFDLVNKGPVAPDAKISTFQNYRFAICYENTELAGYISEKIFDCFAASCVPIYLGEPEIHRFIPTQCFIDRRKFKSNEELYNFIKNMDYAQYNNYIQAISDFMQGVEYNKFGSMPNAERIAKVMLQDLQSPALS